MAKYETVSVKVPAEIKQKLKKYGIKPSKLLRKTLEQEIRRREIEEIKIEIQKTVFLLSVLSFHTFRKNLTK